MIRVVKYMLLGEQRREESLDDPKFFPAPNTYSKFHPDLKMIRIQSLLLVMLLLEVSVRRSSRKIPHGINHSL